MQWWQKWNTWQIWRYSPFFYLQNMLSFPNVHETCRWLRWAQQIWSVVLFFSTFNFNIWYVYLLQQLQQHISLAQCQYIFRELQLMLSNASCNSSQRLSFECTIDLAGLFSNSPQICSMGLRSGHPFTSQCSSRFLPSQVVLAIVRFTGIQQIQLKPLKICQEF